MPLVLSNNTPSAGQISWSAFTLTYAGSVYNFPAGSTSAYAVWWIYPTTSQPGVTYTGTLVTGADFPRDASGNISLTDNDAAMFVNRGGVAINLQNVNIIDGTLVVTSSIIGDAIIANTLDAGRIKASTITSREILAGSIQASDIVVTALGEGVWVNGEMDNYDATSGYPDGWGLWAPSSGTLSNETAAPLSGTQSWKWTFSASGQTRSAMTPAFPVRPGAKYYAGGAFKVSAANTIPVSMAIIFGTTQTFDANSTRVASTMAVPNPTTFVDVNGASIAGLTPPNPSSIANQGYSWIFLSSPISTTQTVIWQAQFVVPAGATWARLVPATGTTTGAGTLLWDAFEVKRVTIGTYIGDGEIQTRNLVANAIDGMTISGATVRTLGNANGAVGSGLAGTPAGVVLDNTGLKGYPAASSTPNTTIDTTTGKLTAVSAVLSGTLDVNSVITGATYRSAVGVGTGTAGTPAGVVLDANGLRGYGAATNQSDTSLDTTTGRLTARFATLSGTLDVNSTITGATYQTAASVGSGLAGSPAGVKLDATGLKAYPAVSTTPNTTIDTASGVLTAKSAVLSGALDAASTITGATYRTATGVGTGTVGTPAGVLLDSTGLRGYPGASSTPNTTIDTATGALTAKSAVLSGTLDVASVITGATYRTATGVGTGTAGTPAGITLDGTGLKGFPAVSTTPNTSIDTTTGKLTATGAALSGTFDVGSGNSALHIDASANLWLGDAIRQGLGAPTITVAETARTNLVTNPGVYNYSTLVTDTTNWTNVLAAGGTATSSASTNKPDTVSGGGSFRTTWTAAETAYGGGPTVGLTTGGIAVTGGSPTTFAIWARPSKGQALAMSVVFYDNTGATVGGPTQIATIGLAASVWGRMIATTTPPATATRAKIRVGNVSGTVGAQTGSLWAVNDWCEATYGIAETTTETDRPYIDAGHKNISAGDRISFFLEQTTAQGTRPNQLDYVVVAAEAILTVNWTLPVQQTITAQRLIARAVSSTAGPGRVTYNYYNFTPAAAATSQRVPQGPRYSGLNVGLPQAKYDTTPANFGVAADGTLTITGGQSITAKMQTAEVGDRVMLDSASSVAPVTFYAADGDERQPGYLRSDLFIAATADLDRAVLALAPNDFSAQTNTYSSFANGVPELRLYGRARGLRAASPDRAYGYAEFKDFADLRISTVPAGSWSISRGIRQRKTFTANATGTNTTAALAFISDSVVLESQRVYRVTFTAYAMGQTTAAGTITLRLKGAATSGAIVASADIGAYQHTMVVNSVAPVQFQAYYVAPAMATGTGTSWYFGVTAEDTAGTWTMYANATNYATMLIEDVGSLV